MFSFDFFQILSLGIILSLMRFSVCFMHKNNALFYPLSFKGLVFWRNLINFFTSSGTAAVLQADKQGTKSLVFRFYSALFQAKIH